MAQQIQVSFRKVFVQGLLGGMEFDETMRFVDWDAACQWAGGVTMNFSCDYVVTEMRGPNGEFAQF
jgi:hypothetical protein